MYNTLYMMSYIYIYIYNTITFGGRWLRFTYFES